MLIVHALLEVASHPEYDIASMTFNFWHSLQVILTKRWNLHGLTKIDGFLFLDEALNIKILVYQGFLYLIW